MTAAIEDRRAPFRRAAVLTFGIWYLVLAAHYLTETLAGRFVWVGEIPADVPAVFAVALLVLAAWPVVVRLEGTRPVVRWPGLAVAIFAIAIAQSLVNVIENLALGVLPSTGPAHHAMIRERFARTLQLHLYLTFANVALMAAQHELGRSAARAVGLAEARAQAARARLEALRLQLNPHFLFNTLNAISSLVVVGRAADADRMIEQLSNFLRASLAEGGGGMVTLAEELATAETYLDIEAVRFGERMAVEIAVGEGLEARMVPGFILQPLIENAVKYGVARTSRPVTIRIAAEALADGGLAIAVGDDGPGTDTPRQSGLGVGTANVRQRLAMLHGPAARLDSGPDAGGGWTARIVLPA